MHTGRRYTALQFFKWTLSDTLWILLLAIIPTVLYVLGLKFISLPWQPVALLGTALAFIVGFKNNASYARMWEARQIYGSIINDSRSFAYTVRDAVGGKDSEIVRLFFNRHFAWLTALRYQLREPRTWENMREKRNRDFKHGRYEIPERLVKIEDALKQYLGKEELNYVLSKKNRATQLSALQSELLAQLRNTGKISEFQWMQIQESMVRLTDHQGKAERIKNFPYPRNFSSVTTFILIVFIAYLPCGLIDQYAGLGNGTFFEGWTVWLNIPLSAAVAWCFHVLDTVGESAVNPFEGSANDVPITQISRLIEIDMLDMLDEKSLPDPIVAQHKILM